MEDIHEPLPLVSLFPLRHQSATSICNGVSSRPAMSSTLSRRGRYNVHSISLRPSSLLKWLLGGFHIPTQTCQNVSTGINYFFFLSVSFPLSVHTWRGFACADFKLLSSLISWRNSLKITPWPSSASELYRASDCRLSAKLVPTFEDTRCLVVSATDPHGRILDFLMNYKFTI
jgi:hypothetical protein